MAKAKMYAITDDNPVYGIANVLQKANAKKGQLQTAPQIVDLRIASKNPDVVEDLVWTGFSTASGVYNVGNDVFIVHGKEHPLIHHQQIRNAIDAGLENHAARLSYAETQAFKEGRIAPQIEYEDFLMRTERSEIAEPYVVRADRALFKGLYNYDFSLDEWRKDPRAILFTGGKQRVEQYADALAKVGVREEIVLGLDVEEGFADRGRLLFLGYIPGNGGGLSGNIGLDWDGRMLALEDKL